MSRSVGLCRPAAGTLPLRKGSGRIFGNDQQVPFQATQSGVERLLERPPTTESFLNIAPQLFLAQPGLGWLHDTIRRPSAPREWLWLRDSSLADGIRTYEGGVKVGFGFIGPSLRLPHILDKWDRHFPNLTARTYVRANYRELYEAPEPPNYGPPLLPSLSAYVFVTPYRWGIELWEEFITGIDLQGRGTALWLMEPGQPEILKKMIGVVFDTDDDVQERRHSRPTRRPDNLAKPPSRGPRVKRGEGGRFALINGVSRMRVLYLLADWDAMIRKDLLDLSKMSSGTLVLSQPRNSSYFGIGLNMNESGLNQGLPESTSIPDLIKY